MLYALRQRMIVMTRIKTTFIKYADVVIDKQKLISEICSSFGCTRKKAAEYIRELLDSEFIIETEEGLRLKQEYKLTAAEQEMIK